MIHIVCLIHLDYRPHDSLNTCRSKRFCLESMDISRSSSYSSPERTHSPMSVAEQSSEVIVGGSTSVDSRRDDKCITNTHNATVRL